MNHDHPPPPRRRSTDGKVSDLLPILLNPDGTITRLRSFPTTPPSPDPTNTVIANSSSSSSSSPSASAAAAAVVSKDLPVNQHHNTWLRLFLSRHHLVSASTRRRLPVIVYFHGGGFIMCSAATSAFHDFCVRMAFHIGAMIVSVEYRLAPEHRLPAAYHDAVDALRSIRSSPDEWIRQFADLSSCFLMGTSSGGNVAFHAGLLAAAATTVDELLPLQIKGLILHESYFGGSRRSESELRLADDPILPLYVNDLQWELSLPIGADRDHEYCNPTVACESEPCEWLRSAGWRVVVTGSDGDPLIDRQRELATALEKKGVPVLARFLPGGYHGVEMRNPAKAKELFMFLRHLVFSPPPPSTSRL